MNNEKNSLPIGVFDSGVGGISVLAEMLQVLPAEKYIYLADSANAPYGLKSCDCVRAISLNIADTLYAKGLKALVVACNTATSVAISNIRERLDIPVIGMEPAIKPAVENGKGGQIVVMATPLTLAEEKFNSLFSRFNAEALIIPLPCPGLVELIESEADSKIGDYLQELFKRVNTSVISAIVLGCTHYCFIRKQLSQVVGNNISIVDGNAGTVQHLKRTLESAGLLHGYHPAPAPIDVKFLSTGDSQSIVLLCERFLARALKSDNAGC